MIKFIKVIGVLSLILLICYVASVIFIRNAIIGFFEPAPGSTTERFINNFEQQEMAILDARDYYISIAPENPEMRFQFYGEASDQIAVSASQYQNKKYYRNSDSLKLDTLLMQLNWTRSNLNTLSSKMSKANCYSIQGRDPVTMAWQGGRREIYSYKIFDRPLDENQIPMFNDSCRYIHYKENIVFEYDGRQKGLDCFQLREK